MLLSRRLAGMIIAISGLVCWAPAQAQHILPTETLTLVTDKGEHKFEVEIARTDEEQARGLMERRYMPADRGMIFDYPDVKPVSMWMENTFIPLDILFVGPDGRIIRIASNNEPMSRRFIPSGGPVRAVVELNAGTAERIGAKIGDTIAISVIKFQPE